MAQPTSSSSIRLGVEVLLVTPHSLHTPRTSLLCLLLTCDNDHGPLLAAQPAHVAVHGHLVRRVDVSGRGGEGQRLRPAAGSVADGVEVLGGTLEFGQVGVVVVSPVGQVLLGGPRRGGGELVGRQTVLD